MSLITVIVPTYRRPVDLERCLKSIKLQSRPVDELLLVARDSDNETWDFLATVPTDYLPIQTIVVSIQGVVAAMNAGLDAARGDIVAFTDDDAAPHTDWLERIDKWFQSDIDLGGIGGRDWQYLNGKIKEPGEKALVGKLQWFGRVIGDHHLAVGPPREVDVLKGVNMAFRKVAINGMRFDERFLGAGAQAHFELAFTLALKRRGWKLIFDPLVAVDHYPAQRFDEDQRGEFNRAAYVNLVHNETVALLDHLSKLRKIIFVIWFIFIGTRISRGIVQWIRFLPKERGLSNQILLASYRGRWRGLLTWWRGKYQFRDKDQYMEIT